MTGKNVNFGDKIMKKSDFYKNKKVTKIDDIDVDKILISKEEPYGTKHSFKYFIGYNYDDAIKSLCIKFPQMIRYVRKFEGNTSISFKINDTKLLKKYNQKWKKVEKLLRKEFDSKPVYGGNDDGNFFDILLVFISFLQTYCGICFFHILSFSSYLPERNFCIYLLLALLILFYHFHSNLLLYLLSRLCFFDR